GAAGANEGVRCRVRLEVRQRTGALLQRPRLGEGGAVTPHTKHRVPRARNRPYEAERVVSRQTAPEKHPDGRDDDERRPVEDDALPRLPGGDLPPPFPPHQVDEEGNRE